MSPLDPRLLPHLAPARRSVAVVVGGSLLGGLLVIGQAFAAGALVARLVVGEDWTAPAVALLAVTAGRALAGWLVDVAGARAAGTVALHMRHSVAAHALCLPELSRPRTGELALLATRGVAAIEPYLTRYLPTLAVAVVLPGATVVTIAVLDRPSALIVALTLPLIPVFAVLVGMATRDRADRQWRTLGLLSGHFLDVVRGLPTLVAYRRAAAQGPRIRAITERYRRATVDTLRLAFLSSATLELVATLSVALVAVAVGLRLADGGLDLQTALVVLLLAPEAYWPLRRVGAEFHAAAEGTATFEAVHALLSAPPPRSGVEPAPRGPAPITVEGLTLRYADRSRPALADLDLTVPATGLTAVVGPSGCGKSTLLQVLLGELSPTSGRIRVGDRPLAEVDPDQWRARVAHQGQRPWLLPDTVRANVRIGAPDASDVDVWRALEAVDLGATVAAMPGGLDALVGEDGAGLSAGQQARLALARAVISDRPWVFLDEPTAHLDGETEQVLLRTIERLAAERCVVVVAHRDAVVEAADHVVVLPPPFAPAEPATPVRAGDVVGAGAVRPVAAPRPDPAPTRPASDTDSAPTPLQGRARWVLAAGLGSLASLAGIALTATAGWLIVRASEHPPVLTLMVAIVGVRLFGLARPVLRYAERLVGHDVALRLLADRRARVYDALVPLVPAALGRRSGDVLGSVVDDVDAVVDDRLRVRLPLATWLIAGAVSVVVATLVLPAAGPVAGAAVLGAGLLGHLVARLGTARREPEYVATRALLSAHVTGVLRDPREHVLWQADRRALAELTRLGRRLARAATRSAAAVAFGRALAVAAGGLAVVAMTAVADSGLRAGDVSAPMAALLVLLPLALVDVVLPVVDAGALRTRTRAADQRLASLAALEPAVTDPVEPIVLPPGEPDLRLASVTTTWPGGRPVRGLHLDAPAGTRMGVVGPSGSGKSTLVAVLLRFLLPTSGTASLGGTDLDRLTGDEVRRHVGLVDDDPYVFSSTLAENVRLARPGADDDAVEAALRAARLGDWLDALPSGLATMLGDGGCAVSGGERARIGLARALLAGHPVLVLDEPTAHLDAETARAVAADVLGAAGSRTVVWVTHTHVGLDRMDHLVDLGEIARQRSDMSAPHVSISLPAGS